LSGGAVHSFAIFVFSVLCGKFFFFFVNFVVDSWLFSLLRMTQNYENCLKQAENEKNGPKPSKSAKKPPKQAQNRGIRRFFPSEHPFSLYPFKSTHDAFGCRINEYYGL